MSEITGVTERYIELYKDNIDKISSISSPYINSFRKAAFEKFSLLGIPTKKNEAYKYTNLNIFFDHDYKSYFMPVLQILLKQKNSGVMSPILMLMVLFC